MWLCDACLRKITEKQLEEDDVYYRDEFTLCRKCDDEAEKIISTFVKNHKKVNYPLGLARKS